jgi:molecular chaperone GrpE
LIENDKRMKSKKSKEKYKGTSNKNVEAAQHSASRDEKVDSSVGQENGKPDYAENNSQEPLISQETFNELNDKYLRLYSEFDNYRKRTNRERSELLKTANQEVISDLLTILDDFERAIKSNEEVTNCNALKEGMVLIYQKLSGLLIKKGLKPIVAIGEDFDTDYHEAITYLAAPSNEMRGKIIDQVEKGYLLNDKVIRYAKVVIGQ